MPVDHLYTTDTADQPEVTPTNTKRGWEHLNRLWNLVAKLREKAMQDEDLTTMEEAEEQLLRIASAFLLAYGKGDAPLPHPVAIWLHAELENALSGFAIPGLRQRANGRTPGELGRYTRETAVAYIKAAREGLIEDNDPVGRVARCYGVDTRNVYKWLNLYQAHAGLGMILQEREWGLAERSAWAKRSLLEHGIAYKLKNTKRR